MVYAFEMEHEYDVAKEEEEVSDIPVAKKDSQRLVTFIHRLVGDSQDYNVVGHPGLVYVHKSFSLDDCLQSICSLVASSVQEQHAVPAVTAAKHGKTSGEPNRYQKTSKKQKGTGRKMTFPQNQKSYKN